jgi:hypothetical protein
MEEPIESAALGLHHDYASLFPSLEQDPAFSWCVIWTFEPLINLMLIRSFRDIQISRCM